MSFFEEDKTETHTPSLYDQREVIAVWELSEDIPRSAVSKVRNVIIYNYKHCSL